MDTHKHINKIRPKTDVHLPWPRNKLWTPNHIRAWANPWAIVVVNKYI